MRNARKRSNYRRGWRGGPRLHSSLIVLAGVLFLTSILHVFDPIGLSQATARQSRLVTERVLSPWWGWGESRWNVPPDASPTAVVLFERRRLALWPPDFAEQSEALAEVARHCPAVIAVDIIYDVPRKDSDFPLAEALDRAVNAGADCERPPAFIFADMATEAPAGDLLNEVYDVVGLTCDEAIRAQRTFFIAPPECPPGRMHSLGVVEWRATEEDVNSRYYTLDNEEFYAPLATVISQDESGDAGETRKPARPSLALATYLAWCARAFEARWTPAEGEGAQPETFHEALIEARDWGEALATGPLWGDLCPRDVMPEALRRYGPQSGGHESADPAEDDFADLFERPIALRWPRWAPRASESYQPDASADTPCAIPSGATMWTRFSESARLLFLAGSGNDPNARRKELARCFPLMTFLIHRHILPPSEPNTPLDRLLIKTQQDPVYGIGSHLRDKAVFVGFHAPSSADVVRTPIQGSLPGVFSHAVAFETLAREGLCYVSVPAPHLRRVGGQIVGSATIIELALLWILSYLMLLARDENWGARRRRRAELMGRSARTIQGCLYGAWLFFGLAAKRAITVIMVVLVGSVLANVLLGQLNNWAISNWIGVSFLSASALVGQVYVSRFVAVARETVARTRARARARADSATANTNDATGDWSSGQ